MKGAQHKSIVLTTNDPVQPTTKIYVTAVVDIEFGFTARSLTFRTIGIDKAAERTTLLIIKNPQAMGDLKFKTSSPYVSAKQTSPIMKVEDQIGTEVTITLQPGMPPGPFRETITAYSTGTDSRSATLNVSGIVKGAVEFVPRSLNFFRPQSGSGESTIIKRLQIINRSEQIPLQVLAVNDPDSRLHLELRTVKENQLYEVTVMVHAEALETPGTVRGTIVVTTNNAGQNNLSVDYAIYNQP